MTISGSIVFSIALLSVFAHASDFRKKPEVDSIPFEPSCESFYNCKDKFLHPPELVPPKFFYPFEMRRSAIDGEAVILVKVDESGYPQKISVLYGTHPLFIRSAISALEQSRWSVDRGSVFFYYKAVFRVDD